MRKTSVKVEVKQFGKKKGTKARRVGTKQGKRLIQTRHSIYVYRPIIIIPLFL